MKTHNFQIPLVALATSLLPALALAATPDPQCMTNTSLPAPTFWPLWDRPGATDAENFDVSNSAKRTHIWNSFGEFQTNTPEYVHTGIDINGVHDVDGGDFVVVAQGGHIYGTHTFNQISCLSADRCKLYIRTNDFRYIYYYAHLNLRPDSDNAMDPDLDSEIRAKIELAVGFPDGVQDSTVYATTEVTAGQVISAVGPFFGVKTHLHFALNDACEHFDGLSPLDWLQGSAHPGYEDQEPPEIDGLFLVNASDDAVLSHENDRCQTVAEDFDVVAQLRDVWIQIPPMADSTFTGNEDLGTKQTKYHFYNATTKTSLLDNIWYTFDQIPFRCIGEARGKDCMETFGLAEYIDEVNLFIPPNGDIGPFLAHTFSNIIYRVTNNFESDSFNGPIYFLNLNHEWGVLDPNQAAERIDVDGLSDGHYQVSVETFDQVGNGKARSLFFDIGSPDPLTDLMIRDNLADTGAIPSTLGGQKHYRSPDIKVFLASDNKTLLPNDPEWDKVQHISLDLGEDYIAYVRVTNGGCEDVEEFDIKVGHANAAMISAGWQTIDTQKHIVMNPPLAPGESTVVEFEWNNVSPGAHRCMLAAVNSDSDVIKDIPVDPMTGDIEMDDPSVDQGSSHYVPFDNNLTQRNITISGSPFKFGNPFASSISLQVDFDCNDLPMHAAGATVALRVQSIGSIGTAWANVPNTTDSFNATNGQYTYTIDRCKIQFPALTVAANTEVNAWVDVTLPGGLTGSWLVDLTANIGGSARDGISVVHTQ